MGLIFSFLSAFFSASKDLVSKKLSFQMDGMSSTFASFGFALPFYVNLLVILLAVEKETVTLTYTFLTLVLLRSVTDSFAEGLKMHAFSHGDISIVASFFSVSPLFLLITSPLITGDKPSLLGIVAVVLVVVGSLALVYRPSHHEWSKQKKGILLAITASFFFSLNSCFDRLAVQQGTPVFAGFTMTLLSTLVFCPFLFGNRERVAILQKYEAGLLVRGFMEIAFMVCKLYALQYLQAPYVVALQRFSLILSIIGGRVFFKETDFARRLASGVLILLGVGLIAWIEINRPFD